MFQLIMFILFDSQDSSVNWDGIDDKETCTIKNMWDNVMGNGGHENNPGMSYMCRWDLGQDGQWGTYACGIILGCPLSVSMGQDMPMGLGTMGGTYDNPGMSHVSMGLGMKQTVRYGVCKGTGRIVLGCPECL